MQIQFFKYQGTGNDFILIDNRALQWHPHEHEVAFLCHRRFGIGADGLMLLENESGFDFKMVYYNSDGKLSSMCGNGGRCISAFAQKLGIAKEKLHFVAVDGPHEAIIEDGLVNLKMQDVRMVQQNNDHYFLNTGSPHFVQLVSHLAEYDVRSAGKAIRYNETYKEEGTNVNFVEKTDDGIFVRTYERGVEDETLSCGTGVTAAALVASLTGISSGKNNCLVKTLGGNLEVSFEKVLEQNFYNIWLKGPAVEVFSGKIELPS